jgi:rhomboid-like protein
MDEDAAIINRIIKEDRQAEAPIIADTKCYTPQYNVESKSHGQSQLEIIREHNEAWVEIKAVKFKNQADEINNLAPNPAFIRHPKGRAVFARRTQAAEWVKRYKEKALLSKLSEPPEMSKMARILPSSVFCLLFTVSCILFAQCYVPPPRRARLWPDIPPAAATCFGLIGANCVVAMLWRLPPLWRLFNRYMLLIPATPKAFSVLGSTFSHHEFLHLSGNMAVLWFVGTKC